MDSKELKSRRRLSGVVVSDKMDKSVVVRVDRSITDSKYLKRLVKSTKYSAHDENNEAKVGDKVVIEETRPISKSKRWRIVTAK
ncbi:30S ribosomal protein S17 [Candidatus Uhrbacteria bacterium CG_4_9_14_0_2_um_filter_41_50]|uniref:Small ribosomal subunit protein uS17 n=1 Tax=Candidatus Uhrbacteria bacterium CG_4_9_14_0_2_um_filter_41_50 TaxID=1975031 RepID=A0A2M8EQ99_9BACT|nr:MAG: 30S ribosomal protein S17 [Candidatus Uhrbacteria bacterium CG_4_10_14_3_um_filter_41_21]PIZ55236.1 MAG: 30S ribosomal protein S17 [Candidatus Uhrbacteria bacterium CG_4_10_14_0_2_um_filter_41_21]PJB84374.1 MAG: 30S ribosomal protein S17 [Candidatus Uhrbacteria bacterium CG_4_9_14_0_8_um_filter_41_16]PJC24916.1 MAG: 30S ribosomal protein S17 [Candidatus Uhrbacteria bacterium CG_4_9_14_0_2_um_filter_41_50]PJE74978.1 MAG: 30S ribosomal protein S17 [Candidatus Uhrbacteria bacterium CG10_bi